jgi:glycerophosphoryl diester phosphodiesterase
MTARPFVIAHRGFSGQYPENSLAAIEGAIRLGADFVEIDIQETLDGRLAVFHDYRLARLCGAPGRVRDTTFARLRALNPHVPSLEEALQTCRGRTRLLIEIKRADPRLVAAAIQRHGMSRDVIVFSLSVPYLVELASVAPHIQRFGLIAMNLRSRLRQLAASVSVEGLGLSRHLIGSRAAVERLRERGGRVFVWTVNREPEMQRLARWGVDGLITDHPDRALRVLNAM